jgi:hypothetical protein
LLQAIAAIGLPATKAVEAAEPRGNDEPDVSDSPVGAVTGCDDGTIAGAAASPMPGTVPFDKAAAEVSTSPVGEDDLIERARQEDARHWAEHQRPISAETLRKQLRIGAARSRMLVSIIRADQSG